MANEESLSSQSRCCILCGSADRVQSHSLDGTLTLCRKCGAQAQSLEQKTLRKPQPYKVPSNLGHRIFVGCEHSTRDALHLQESLHIGHVIVAARMADTHLNTNILPCTVLDIDDDPLENISHYFDQVYDIYQRLPSEDGLLIHCVSGISRSGALAVALLMRLLKLSYQQALVLAQQSRPCIAPNSGFQKQLLEYEATLQQQRRNYVKEKSS